VSRRSDSGLDGILLVDKPRGWTSHDVVAKVRLITGQRRIGHTGTLDPMATGLLTLCLGNATRLVEFLIGHDKRYTATVTLGQATTTDDAEGGVLEACPIPELAASTLEAALDGFRGPILQTPPAFSALKVGGRRAYDLARAGAPPEMAPRSITIYSLQGEFAGPAAVELDLTCSSGTYVRSLARDLGIALGTVAHLSTLRRERAGPFSIGAGHTLEDIEAAADAGTIGEFLAPADEGIADMEAAILGMEGATSIANGLAWMTAIPPVGDRFPVRIYAASGSFVGVGSVSSLGRIHASKVLWRDKSAN